MRAYLYAALLVGLASCTRPNTPPPPASEPISAAPADTTRNREFVRVNSDNPAENGPSRKLDSVVVQRTPSFLDKLLHRTPKPWKVAPVTAHQRIAIGKKANVQVYYGTATVSNTTVGKKATAATAAGAVASVTGKKSGPAVVASDSSTLTNIDNTKAGQRGGAAATGAGATATATTIKPPTPWLKYGLWALGALGGYWVLFGGGGAVLLALWRRNKSNSNQA